MYVLTAQLNYVVGDIEGNADKIIDTIKKNDNTNDLIVFSELCITGYPPLDLLDDSTFLDKQDDALKRIAKASSEFPERGYAIGHVRRENGKLFNSVSVIQDGRVVFVYDKKKLPTYNIFDEDRYFTEGARNNLCKFKGNTIAFFICEDIWPEKGEVISEPVKNTPRVADVAISLNASPSNVGKLKDRYILSESMVSHLQCPHIYVNQFGGYDELVFDGNSFCMNSSGIVVSKSNKFAEDLVSINTELAEQKMSNGKFIVQSGETQIKEFEPMDTLYHHAVIGIRDYVNKCEFHGVVIGSSGGIDSAMVMALACDAVGPENVVAITMPTQFSSDGSVSDSKTLCDNLGIKLFEHAIGDTFDNINGNFVKTFDAEKYGFGVTQENMQARIRGTILMAYSNMFGNLVLSTGNKSEMSVGYATLYGDMNGGINPLGDMYKSEVYSLANHYNHIKGKEIIPLSIINKEPSAELAPDQVDSNSLVPYNILDKILQIYIEGDVMDSVKLNFIKYLLKIHMQNGEVTEEDIVKMVRLVIKSEYKRKQAPPIIRCQQKAFGFGRNLPVASNNNDDAVTILKKFR